MALSLPCTPQARWVVVGMCYIMGICNYLMRANLSVAIVCMNSDPVENVNGTNGPQGLISINMTTEVDASAVKEFQWSRQLRGWILGAFFIGYIPFQLPSGWLVNRYGGKWPIFWGVGLLTLATFLSPVSARLSPYLLLLVQILKGIVCSVVYPGLYQIIGNWSLPTERGKILSFAMTGSTMGTFISFGLSGWLCEEGFAGGWPSLFYVYALISCVFLVLFVFLVHDSPRQHPCISWREKEYFESSAEDKYEVNSSIPWRSMLMSVPVWSIIVADMCAGWLWYWGLTLMPQYIHDVLKFDIKKNGLISSTAYLFVCTTPWFAGWLSDWLISKRVLKTIHARKVFFAIALLVPAALLIVLGFLGEDKSTPAAVCLILAFAVMGWYNMGNSINMQDIAPRFMGVMKGLANFGCNISGLLAPVITGALTTNGLRHEWQHVFILSAVICIIGVVEFSIFAVANVQAWARVPPTDHNVSLNQKTHNTASNTTAV